MTKTSQPLVSIIIPIYNIENYLSACLDSVTNQTYKNIEIIAVDDGSTDDSNKIAKAYAAKDKRIKIIEKQNGGQGDARNRGSEIASGDYIAFVDGDDYISKYFIETLLKAISDNNADISTCKYKLTYTSNDRSLEREAKNEVSIYNTKEALKRLFYQKDITTSPCCKLYKRELLEGIKFPVGKKYEDLATIYKIIAKAKTVAIGQATLLYYVQSNNSTMRRAFRPSRLDGLTFAEEAIEFTKSNIPELETAATNRAFTEAIYIFEEIINSQYKGKAEQKIVWNAIKKYREIVKKDKESKKNIRAYARVSHLGKQALRMALEAKEQYGAIKARHLRK